MYVVQERRATNFEADPIFLSGFSSVGWHHAWDGEMGIPAISRTISFRSSCLATRPNLLQFLSPTILPTTFLIQKKVHRSPFFVAMKLGNDRSDGITNSSYICARTSYTRLHSSKPFFLSHDSIPGMSRWIRRPLISAWTDRTVSLFWCTLPTPRVRWEIELARWKVACFLLARAYNQLPFSYSNCITAKLFFSWNFTRMPAHCRVRYPDPRNLTFWLQMQYIRWLPWTCFHMLKYVSNQTTWTFHHSINVFFGWILNGKSTK